MFFNNLTMKTTAFKPVVITAILSFSLFWTNCKKDEPKPKPVITSFTPVSAYAGTQVTITGENFKEDPGSNIVMFNNTPATVRAATTTQLVTTVPAGASTGKIAITVNGSTGSSETDFTVLVAQTITSFVPTSGVAGTTVTITGTDFSATPTDNIVLFNGKQATILSATSTTLTATVPAGSTTGKISVTINGIPAISASDFTIPGPTITSFVPVHAVAGATVTVTGTNFIAGDLSLNKVKINNTDATVTAATSTQLTITVPAATTGLITVTVDGQDVSSGSSFEVLVDIPRTGLVAFYPFSGDANDVSGNNLNGTPTNGPTLTSDRFTTADHAYNFDGVNDYITLGNPPLLQISNVITVSGWINITAFRASHNPSTGAMEIIKKLYNDPALGGNPTKGFRFLQDFTGGSVASFSAFIYSYAGTTLTQYTGTYLGNTPLALSDWIFFAMVIDNKSLKFYQNGTLVNDFTQPNNIMDDGTLGNWIISDNQYFNGKIDDVAIYNRALPANEVTQLYQQTITKY